MKPMTKLICAAVALGVLVVGARAPVEAGTPDKEKVYDNYLLKSLKDSNLGIRTSAIRLLGERKVAEAVDPLIEILEKDSNYQARIMAAMALYQIGDPTILSVMKRVAVSDKRKTVRRVVTGIVQALEKQQIGEVIAD